MDIVGSIEERTAPFSIEVVVRDLEAVVAFYRSIGFELVREVPRFVTLKWGGFYLFVAQNDEAIGVPRWANLRIVVDDVDRVWERLTAMGVPVVHAIGDRPYGLRDFTIRDPGGFEVRFAQSI